MRDKEAKESLIKYLQESKDERLWQAIRNWSDYPFIYGGDMLPDGVAGVEDTFYKEGR